MLWNEQRGILHVLSTQQADIPDSEVCLQISQFLGIEGSWRKQKDTRPRKPHVVAPQSIAAASRDQMSSREPTAPPSQIVAADPELAHLGVESRAFETQAIGSAIWTGDYSLSLTQDVEDVLPLSRFEGRRDGFWFAGGF